jgi:hypothetical protein
MHYFDVDVVGSNFFSKKNCLDVGDGYAAADYI